MKHGHINELLAINIQRLDTYIISYYMCKYLVRYSDSRVFRNRDSHLDINIEFSWDSRIIYVHMYIRTLRIKKNILRCLVVIVTVFHVS